MKKLKTEKEPGENGTGITYTFDVFASLDGYGSHNGNWGGYWGKQGPELLKHRLDLYSEKQRMIFGSGTYRQFLQIMGSGMEKSGVGDPWVKLMLNMPAVVISNTLTEPLESPNGTLVHGDAVDIVAGVKKESLTSS